VSGHEHYTPDLVRVVRDGLPAVAELGETLTELLAMRAHSMSLPGPEPDTYIALTFGEYVEGLGLNVELVEELMRWTAGR
jgi:hypothetical protein